MPRDCTELFLSRFSFDEQSKISDLGPRFQNMTRKNEVIRQVRGPARGPRAVQAKGRSTTLPSRRTRQNTPRPMVGLAPGATNVRTRQSTVTSNDGHSCRFKGTDFVRAISSGAGLVAGEVITTLAANPRSIGVSRLAIASSVWERFKFRSLKFHYAPIANATQTGSLIGYVDYDVDDEPTGTGDANLQRAWAAYGQQSCQIWGDTGKRTTWELKDVDPMTDLYIDAPSEDAHWTSQGLFVLLSASTIAASLPLGNIFVEYDVEFFIPQIEVSPLSGAGYKLTSGGVMSAAVPFGDAEAVAVWSNIDVDHNAAKTFLVPPGCYIATLTLGGTAITASGISGAGDGYTEITRVNPINAAATIACGNLQWISTGETTITVACTATTITNAIFILAALPSDADSLSRRYRRKLDRLVSQFSAIRGLQSAILSQNLKPNPRVLVTERKAKMPVPSDELDPTRRTLAGDNQNLRTPPGSAVRRTIDVDEDYAVVHRGPLGRN